MGDEVALSTPERLDILKNKVITVNLTTEKVEEMVQKIFAIEIKALAELLKEIEAANEKNLAMGIRMNDNQLENWVLKLPLVIDAIAERAEQRALDVDIAETIAKEHWNAAFVKAGENLKVSGEKKMAGYTVAKQKAVADQAVAIDAYVAIIKNRIYKRIEAKINSAEKVFYSLKTILGKRL